MTKKKLCKACLLILLTSIIFSCTEEDVPNNAFKQYAGNYKSISFKSNVAVDLNNDGFASEQLTSEINSFSYGDLEIRPHDYQLNDAKLVSFRLPKTWMTFEYPGSPDGSVQFIGYGFTTTYQFMNGAFVLAENSYLEKSYTDNIESNKNVTLNSELLIIDDNHLKISISKEYYDFNSSDWIMLDIEVVYERQ
ncbi:MAG: hypothetical protein RLO17_09595 [Cyclobacteriaceae bacterium]